MAELFGFSIQRSNKDKGGERTFSTPTPDDGTIDVAGGGFFGQILDTDGRERSDIDLTSESAADIETFDVTWRYQHFEASGVNF